MRLPEVIHLKLGWWKNNSIHVNDNYVVCRSWERSTEMCPWMTWMREWGPAKARCSAQIAALTTTRARTMLTWGGSGRSLCLAKTSEAATSGLQVVTLGRWVALQTKPKTSKISKKTLMPKSKKRKCRETAGKKSIFNIDFDLLSRTNCEVKLNIPMIFPRVRISLILYGCNSRFITQIDGHVSAYILQELSKISSVVNLYDVIICDNICLLTRLNWVYQYLDCCCYAANSIWSRDASKICNPCLE